MWLGAGSTQDITYGYAAPPTDPAGQPFLVGAENAAGAGEMSATLPTTDLAIVSTDPEPGDSLRYTVTVKGLRPGDGVVHSEMDADGVSGTTVVETRLPVTR